MQTQLRIIPPAGKVFTIINVSTPFDVSQVRRYQLNLDSRITDLVHLSNQEKTEVTGCLKGIYRSVEGSANPGAGYEAHFYSRGKGKTAVITLDVCGERTPDQKMQMPTARGTDCFFCTNTEQMPGYEEAKTEHGRVLKSLEGNPLTISNQHFSCFLDMNEAEEAGMLSTAGKVIEIGTNGKITAYQISAHNGIAGHQTVPHAHNHVVVSLPVGGNEKVVSEERQGANSSVIHSDSPHRLIQVRRYQLNIDPRLTDLTDKMVVENSEILHVLNQLHTQIENSSNPAAYYVVQIKVIAKGKRPIEVYFDACGERKAGVANETKEKCSSCQNTELLPQYEQANTEDAHVLKNEEGSPIISSKQHYHHVFEMPEEKQNEMLKTVIKAIEIGTEGLSSRYQIKWVVGSSEDESSSHAHMQVLASIKKKQ